MRRSILILACAGVIGCLVGSDARAKVMFSYEAGSTSYTGATGSSVPVNIYLLETLTGSSTDIIAPNGGLVAGGAAVNVTGTTGGTAASIASASFTPQSSFSVGSHSVYYNQVPGGNNLEFAEVAGVAVDATAGQILLGTVNITVGTGTTTYSLTSLYMDTIANSSSDLGQENDNTVTANDTDLDVSGTSGAGSAYTGANAATAFSFTVSPASIPEPASLALLGMGGLGLLRRSRRQS